MEKDKQEGGVSMGKDAVKAWSGLVVHAEKPSDESRAADEHTLTKAGRKSLLKVIAAKLKDKPTPPVKVSLLQVMNDDPGDGDPEVDLLKWLIEADITNLEPAEGHTSEELEEPSRFVDDFANTSDASSQFSDEESVDGALRDAQDKISLVATKIWTEMGPQQQACPSLVAFACRAPDPKFDAGTVAGDGILMDSRVDQDGKGDRPGPRSSPTQSPMQLRPNVGFNRFQPLNVQAPVQNVRVSPSARLQY
jgi:hypothetical protein